MSAPVHPSPQTVTDDGRELCIASAFFTLDALLLLAETLDGYAKVRLLFGDDADATQRRKLMEKAKMASETDLLKQREERLALLCALLGRGREEGGVSPPSLRRGRRGENKGRHRRLPRQVWVLLRLLFRLPQDWGQGGLFPSERGPRSPAR